MADPTADLERLRAMHDRLLNGYGFHDDYDRATADLGALGRLLARTDGDDGPVTEEWLQSLGLGRCSEHPRPKIGGTTLNVYTDGATLRLCLSDGYYTNGVRLPGTTRGHVRRLLAALGIPPDPRRTT